YTISGTLKGSWQLDNANAQPTGLTINPNSPSDIWVVDSGTNTVYKYANAAGKTSGSLKAASTFALAANNTNPQDIADPPVGEMLTNPAPVPLPTNLPARATLSAVGLTSVPAVAVIPPLTGHDALWAMLGRDILKKGNEP